MRQITCRFEDGSTFLDQLESPALGGNSEPVLNLSANFGLRCGQIIRVAIIIADPGERHDLHLQIVDRTATIRDGAPGIQWNYRAAATAEDAPWIEMLIKKHSAAAQMTKFRA